MPAEGRLHDCRAHDAERDAADGLRGETDDAVAGFTCEVPAEAQHAVGGALALHEHDAGNGDGEQELHQQPADASHRARRPEHRRRRVRCRRLRDVGQTAGRERLPRLDGLRSDDGQRAQPRGRVRYRERAQTGGPLDDLTGIGDDGADGERQRQDQHEKQRADDRGHGQLAAVPEPGLELPHHGPRRHDDHRGPDNRAEEGPQNPDRQRDQHDDDQNAQRGAREIRLRERGLCGRHASPLRPIALATSTASSTVVNAMPSSPSSTTSVRADGDTGRMSP